MPEHPEMPFECICKGTFNYCPYHAEYQKDWYFKGRYWKQMSKDRRLPKWEQDKSKLGY